MPLRLYNTLTRTEEDFVPRDHARVTFYSCGPTVYDDAHIGNFRSFLAADVLRRWVESSLCELKGADGKTHKGPRKVVHVMNITDVGHMTDDAEGGEAGEDRMAVAGKRIAEAKKSGKLPADVKIDPGDPYQIARFYEDRFKDDAKRLGLKLAIEAESDPTLQPRATESVPGMIELVKRLIAQGFAYVVGGAGERVVYFDVQKFPTYGRLSGNTLDQLRAGAGGRVAATNQASKRHPADFLLWKEDSSHLMKWDSPWGAGYPGWHIECSVMSAARILADTVIDESWRNQLTRLVFEQAAAIGVRARDLGAHALNFGALFSRFIRAIGDSQPIAGRRRFSAAAILARFVADRLLRDVPTGALSQDWSGGLHTIADAPATSTVGDYLRDMSLAPKFRSAAQKLIGDFGESWTVMQSVNIPNGEALIDLHSGGEDNIFPHHECEIAQSCGAFNATPDKGGYARLWFHPRFLLVEGTKMSKSKGNFFTARDLFAKGVEPAALRLELVRTHYRSNANFTMQGLADSQRQVERWRRFVETAAGDASHSQGSRDDAMLGFAQALNADLNIAAAIAEVNKFVARTEKPGTQDAELMKVFDAVLGVLELRRPASASMEIGIFAPGVAPDPSVVAKLQERRSARAAKDFARSDTIRDELLAMGYSIKDVAGGKVEVRRAGA